MNVEVGHRVRSRPGVLPESAPTPAIGVLGALALKIVYRPIGTLKPSPRNARTHSDKQIHKLTASFQRFGFVGPILVDGAGEVIAGHGRLEAARRLGMPEVPTICLDHMNTATSPARDACRRVQDAVEGGTGARPRKAREGSVRNVWPAPPVDGPCESRRHRRNG